MGISGLVPSGKLYKKLLNITINKWENSLLIMAMFNSKLQQITNPLNQPPRISLRSGSDRDSTRRDFDPQRWRTRPVKRMKRKRQIWRRKKEPPPKSPSFFMTRGSSFYSG